MIFSNNNTLNHPRVLSSVNTVEVRQKKCDVVNEIDVAAVRPESNKQNMNDEGRSGLWLARMYRDDAEERIDLRPSYD